MFYPAKFEPEDGGYCVSFRDIPEALTCGDDLTHAIEMAEDALLTALDFYFDDARPVPLPSDLQEGERWVALPTAVYAKVLLLNAMLAQNTGNAELARRLGRTCKKCSALSTSNRKPKSTHWHKRCCS